jgi:Rieske Fe-S protein
VGSGLILEEPADYVVTQPTKGEFRAFTAICTHQQCRVTELRDDVIFCACHQSEFSIKDGSVVQDPAPAPLAEFQVTVSGGKVYVEE